MIVYVVGLGPGSRDEITYKAFSCLEQCELIVGYTVYVDLIREWFPDKEFYTTGMTGEKKRCEYAISQARSGKSVAVVCSGDGQVYGMAGLLLELSGEAGEPEIKVIPGVTCALSAGALLGAPLTCDFAVISLSDHLTPWSRIERKLLRSAEAGLVISLYNPASRMRPDHLRRACDVLLTILSPDTPCGVARNVGRSGEECRIMTLRELSGYPADMFTTVFIGNESTRVIQNKLVTPRGYLTDGK